ncbi:MAG: transporter substrate-binding domain-containing protein [Rhodoferax sp.]|nr:transporter substrate-binding domain-containing protein [Rhodoferax sp.]
MELNGRTLFLCLLTTILLSVKIVDMAAADQVDFAVVGFIATPERQKRVLFSKAYFQSISVWMAKPSVAAGNSRSSVAVIKGSAQASHAQAMGWKTIQGATNVEITSMLASGVADAAVLPMLGALSLAQGSLASALGTEVHGAERPPHHGYFAHGHQPKATGAGRPHQCGH